MTDEMKQWMKVIAGCLIIAAGFVSCSESITNPLTPGSGLLNRDVNIKDTTLVATSDSVFQLRVPPDSLLIFSPLRRNLVGKNGAYTAYAAFRFFPPARDTINVLSAKLTLRLIARQGDAAGMFAFTVHKILSDWSQTQLTWTKATAANFFEQTPVRGTYSSTANPDTQEISITLDTTMVREWYRTGVTSYGFMLVPTSACNIIRGIHAFDFDSTKYWPKLEVIAQNIAGTVRDTTSFQIASSGIGGAGADTYVANVDPFPINNERIYSQAGIVYRSTLRFDVSQFPRGTIINSAELLLERDPALTILHGFSPNAVPSVHALIRSDSVFFPLAAATGSLKSGTQNTYTFDIRAQVQQLINKTAFGFVLRQPDANEFNTLDLFAFYGSRAANTALRPRILVKYTLFTN